MEQSILEHPKESELIKNSNKDVKGLQKNKNFLKKLEYDGIYKLGVTSEGMVTRTLARPVDLSLRQVYRTKIKSAILCDRITSLKKKHFKLDFYLGKIVLKDHPLFSEEDKRAIELIDIHEEFERVAGLGMIPFYENRIKALK